MAAYSVTGDLHLMADGAVEGWLWSRDRPDRRLTAEVLCEGMSIGATVSELYRRDLAGRGVGDGRHAFRLALPHGAVTADGPTVITAREHTTQQVFARIVRGGQTLTPLHRAGIEQARDNLQDVATGVAALLARTLPGKERRVRDACAQLSALLAARTCAGPGVPGRAATATFERLRVLAAGLDLPRVGRPALSVLLPPGDDAAVALRRIRALAPALGETEAELLLLDDGTDPASALLPALVPNLVYLRATAPGDSAHLLTDAAHEARGAVVAVLEPQPAEPPAASLLALARQMRSSPRTVLLGAATLAACARAGLLDHEPAECPAPFRLGLRIALARDLLAAAGGLDGAMEDGAALESADLWLRCRMLGAVAVYWREPQASPGPVARQREGSPQALAAFHRRWGI